MLGYPDFGGIRNGSSPAVGHGVLIAPILRAVQERLESADLFVFPCGMYSSIASTRNAHVKSANEAMSGQRKDHPTGRCQVRSSGYL
jgi:hypothetical protein